MDFSLDLVFDVSVSAPGAGVGQFNTSNLAVFTHEVYNPTTFGSDGYKLFVDPADIADDFGSAAITTKLVNAIFSQKPNIRANGGYCVVIPMLAEQQSVTFDLTPASGSFDLTIDGTLIAGINWNTTPAALQAQIRAAAPKFAQVVVAAGTPNGYLITLNGIYGPVADAVVSNNTLEDAGTTPVVITVAEEQAGETVATAITRTKDLVHYFGLIATVEEAQADLLAAAAVLAPLRKIGFFLGSTEASVDVGGKLDLLRTGSFTNSRGLLRIDTLENGLVYCAAYAGRALSTNFSGSNTTQTMHLKDLIGVQPDGAITSNILAKAQAAGADVYISFRGVPKTFTSGANEFFDNVYNILWFVEALQVAEFNVLAQTSTKIAQTEGGMDVLKGAARKVCEQAVTNQFSAPGEWTSPTTFGPQADFFDNIRQRGYYIYSQPISQQAVVEREARQAPLIQVALKYAGSIHKGNILVNINK